MVYKVIGVKVRPAGQLEELLNEMEKKDGNLYMHMLFVKVYTRKI